MNENNTETDDTTTQNQQNIPLNKQYIFKLGKISRLVLIKKDTNQITTISNMKSILMSAEIKEKFDKDHHISLKISLVLSSIFILFYFIYPNMLNEIISKINII